MLQSGAPMVELIEVHARIIARVFGDGILLVREEGAAVAARKKDLSKVTTDMANFLAQRDEAGGKKTMRSYLWSLELAAYDAQHNG